MGHEGEQCKTIQKEEPRQKKLKVKEPKLPNGSVDKESMCNAGDPGSIPGSGRSAGEGIGYPVQYSWASLRLSW